MDAILQTTMDIVAKAEIALHSGEIKTATELMHEALTAAPRDPSVLTAFGSMLAEVGNTEKAILTLKKAARLAPDDGYEKFMCGTPPCTYCGIVKRMHAC
jgi:Flp pilus assembly protein TadD